MTAGRICSRVVASASAQETVRAAAKRMTANEVGTLVVLEAGNGPKPVGILTDRDITVRCVAAGRDPDQTRIADVMTRPVQFVEEQLPIEEAIATMAKVGTRRLVVVGEAGRLVGVLSLDDILDLLADEAGAIARLLGKQQAQVTA